MVHSDGNPENQQDQPPHLVFLEKKINKLNLHSINTCVDVYVIFFVNYLLFLGKLLAFGLDPQNNCGQQLLSTELTVLLFNYICSKYGF